MIAPGPSTGPEVTYEFEGEVISSHMDITQYIYDDLYGYALGALQGQGAAAKQRKVLHALAL